MDYLCDCYTRSSYDFLSMLHREDLSFESKYESVPTEVIKQNNDLYVLQIITPGCPAIQREGANMKSDFEFLKENNILYYLVADIIYNSKADIDLDEC